MAFDLNELKQFRDTITQSAGKVGQALDPRDLMQKVQPFMDVLNKSKAQTEKVSTKQPKPVTPKENPLPPIRTRADHIAGYNLRGYSTREAHIAEVREIYGSTPRELETPELVQHEIDRVMKVKNQAKPPKSPITGGMILSAAEDWQVDPRLIIALMRKETGLGLEGKGVRYKNPGNIHISDEGRVQEYKDWQEGVNAVARELARRKINAL